MVAATIYFETGPRQRFPNWLSYALIWLAFGLLVSVLHINAIGLVDTPGQKPISILQGLTAAFANTLGPWAGHVVRMVDFPNAGLRSFRMLPAITMTAVLIALLYLGRGRSQKWGQILALITFVLFMFMWYGYGFFLIADGLL